MNQYWFIINKYYLIFLVRADNIDAFAPSILVIRIIISRSSFLSSKTRFSMLRIQIVIKFISIGSYFPKVCAFGTLTTTTKVYKLVICKTL